MSRFKNAMHNYLKKLRIFLLLLLAAAALLSPRQLRLQETDRQWQIKADSKLRREWLAAVREEKDLKLSAVGREKTWRRVIVRLAGEDELSMPSGLKLMARRGDLAAALLDLSKLPQVASSEAVRYIRSERLFFPCDDPGVLSVRAARVPIKLSVTGKGVLLGVLDSGIDWKHRDFRRSDGSTRIVAILDMSLTIDSLTNRDYAEDGPFGGVLFTEERINEALENGEEIGHCDYMGHGTHVTGSAAATPVVPPDTIGVYGGVAPDADIVFIKVSRTPRDSLFGDANIMNGLAFLDSLARARGQPYVCNMSFGSMLGSHDGRDPFESFIADFAKDSPPGQAIVVASGNERRKRNHASGSLSSNGGDSLELTVNINGSGSKNDELRVEIWLSEEHPGLTFSLAGPGGNLYGPYEDGYSSGDTLFTEDGILVVENAYLGPEPESGDRLIAVEFYDLAALDEEIDLEDNVEIARGTWSFILESDTGSFDAYLYGTSGLNARFGTYASELGSVTVPGTHPELITVGAYATRQDWNPLEESVSSARNYVGRLTPGELTYFTGLGPNRKGVIKPDITAPGRWVMASMSSYAWPLDEPLSMFGSPIGSKPLLMIATDSIHAASQGTSFATPMVAGIAALLLEADPGLTQRQIKDLLTSTATSDSATGAGLPDNFWGYGRADAISSLYQVLGLEDEPLAMTTALSPADTLWTDSLRYSVSIDFTRSKHVMRSARVSIRWPAEFLRVLAPQSDGPVAEGPVMLYYDTAELENGVLGVEITAEHGVPAPG
ncbi:MAG: S8 family serine peptidase, partial [Gemmatimonadota bacterium]|nr:S8 family serine peptidase [Gemmatimonadota bacterium]